MFSNLPRVSFTTKLSEGSTLTSCGSIASIDGVLADFSLSISTTPKKISTTFGTKDLVQFPVSPSEDVLPVPMVPVVRKRKFGFRGEQCRVKTAPAPRACLPTSDSAFALLEATVKETVPESGIKSLLECILTIPLPTPEEKSAASTEDASEPASIPTSIALDEQAFAELRSACNIPTIIITPGTPLSSPGPSPSPSFESLEESGLLHSYYIPTPKPITSYASFEPSSALVPDIDWNNLDLANTLATIGLISAEAQAEIDEADRRMEETLAAARARGPTQTAIRLMNQQAKDGSGIQVLAQDWDEDGEFAAFEYNMVSSDCSHPDLCLCTIEEEGEEKEEVEVANGAADWMTEDEESLPDLSDF